MAIEKELLDRLLAGRDPNEVFVKDGLVDDGAFGATRRLMSTSAMSARPTGLPTGVTGIRRRRY
jgi:hypothetical protein